jgi:hypothetical protein
MDFTHTLLSGQFHVWTMTERTNERQLPTRRSYLRGLVTVGAFGGLAGCQGQDEDGQMTPTAVPTPTETPANSETPARTETPTATTTKTETPSPDEGEMSTPREPRVIWLSPDGDDDAAGTEDDPLRTFDAAVNRRAKPGDTVRAKSGVYRQFLTMRRGGEPGAPITTTGPPDAILRPEPGAGQILRIHHSHVHLTGLTIDGLLDPDRKFEALSSWAAIGVDISPYAGFNEASVLARASRVG